MTSRARATPAPGRFVIDARYVEAKPSGIGRYVEALVTRLPELAPSRSFELWSHPSRPQPVIRPNTTCRTVAAPADGLRTLLAPTRLGPLAVDDVVHFPFSILGRGLPCATVVTIHDLMWLEQPELVEGRPLLRRVREKYYQRGMLWALRRATRLIAVSEATRARMVATVPECADRVRVTHNAADSLFRPPTDPKHALSQAAEVVGSRAPYYLVVGKNEPYKAHELAIAAFAKVAREDELLVLIQRASSSRRLVELARRLGIASRLRFLSAISAEQLVAVLQSAKALIQPSLVEGFGIPVLEAMASGCPVVTSDCPALVEVTAGAGLLAPVGSAAGLADALERLRAPGMTDKLRQQGLVRAQAFDWQRTAEQTLAIYEEAAAAHAARAQARTA